jgi:aminoglycoside phosphotransferase (APT) family kinase protein
MNLPPDVIPVRERHRFSEGRLADFLRETVPSFAGPLEILQFAGGQSNPTYYLRTPARGYVLRRKPPGKLLPSAHAVDREYRIISALAKTNVPVAKPVVLCEDPEVIGTAFYVMEHVRGRIFRDPLLPGLKPPERAAIYDAMNEILARLHGLDLAALGLEDYGRSGDYVARQVSRWTKQYRASETEHIPEMERLIDWLPRHVPQPDETALVHGDYRLENLILHPSEPRVVAVLDWELSTLGHPLCDLAYNCMLFRTGPADYGGFGGIDIATLGIPREADYVASYCARAGRPLVPAADWEFYLAFSMFRIAAILQGIMGRVVAGTAANRNAEERARRAPLIARVGWEIVERREGS